MLESDAPKGVLYFRQSLLLLRLNCPEAAMQSLQLARQHASTEHERLVYEGWILYDTGHCEGGLRKAEESIKLNRSFEAFFLKAYALADSSRDPSGSVTVVSLLEDALKCPSDRLRKGQALNNLGSVYVDHGKLDLAGRNNASAYEKRSEYCDRELAKADLEIVTKLDPLRVYPYKYRAAVLMDNHKEKEAIAELSRAIAFKADLHLLHLRAAFYEHIGDVLAALRDCRAALSVDPNHQEMLEFHSRRFAFLSSATNLMIASLLFGVVLITIPSSYGLSVSCMMEYDDGGAPAVYGYPECPQWVLSSAGSLQNQNLNCQFAILQGRRDYQEDAIACNLDIKVPLLAKDAGKNEFEEEAVGIVAVFDGHGGKECSEMASKLLFDYFYLHVVFQSYKVMAYHNGVLPSSDYKSFQLEILKEALSKTIGDIDLRFSQEAIKNNFFSGSTATVVLLYGRQILVANVGDSKALLLSEKIQSALRTEGDSTAHLSATALTYDHHPDREDERARIEAAGGSVTNWGVPRVSGVLAMSRSIEGGGFWKLMKSFINSYVPSWDHSLPDLFLIIYHDVPTVINNCPDLLIQTYSCSVIRYGVIAEPEYTGWRPLTTNDTHLVVASDGIFESLTPQDIGNLIFQWNSHFQGSEDSKMPFSCLSSTSLAECIINTAYEKGSHDNLSVIIVPLT
ncbi:hypothetical protein GH714_036852 [Hevea brasiliensis]|uniref:protein-serine/threonine phosphatase n=1 Tax=Hevea brasiliensis TaxID=3981 RepID=A0A6A6MNH9_HEVBR|nr:hypothetical protein GH714_036852 [Hevea brasiliensis]